MRKKRKRDSCKFYETMHKSERGRLLILIVNFRSKIYIDGGNINERYIREFVALRAKKTRKKRNRDQERTFPRYGECFRELRTIEQSNVRLLYRDARMLITPRAIYN